MNVIQRNFLKLLAAGTFGSDEPLEPMSPYKWRLLFQLSLMHGVAALVYDGITIRKDDFNLCLPSDLRASWAKTVTEIERANQETNICLSELFNSLSRQRLRPILLKGQSMSVIYPNPLHRTSGDIDVYLPYDKQSQDAVEWLSSQSTEYESKGRGVTRFIWNNISVEHHVQMHRLTNPLLNRKLQKIINREIRCCDSYYIAINGLRIESVPPTLNLLLIIARITGFLLNEGISLKQLVDLGMFLRKIGDKVDYVLLQSQLEKIGMQKSADIIGNIMMRMFHFDADELPFMKKVNGETSLDTIAEVFRTGQYQADDLYFTQGKNIFVHSNNSSAMLWHIRHSIRFMRYYPGEAFTNLFASFAHSLSHIEE